MKALDNTLQHLQNRNSNYRDGFLNKGTMPSDVEQKNAIEQQMRAASDTLARKKKDLDQRAKEYDDNLKKYNEIQTKVTQWKIFSQNSINS